MTNSVVVGSETLPMLSDAFMKADWAEYCLRSLENSVDWYTKNCMRVTIKEAAIGSSSYEVLMETAPLTPLGLEVGDIIRNLRGALDAAVSAVYRTHGKSENNAYWPFGDLKVNFEATVIGSIVKAGFAEIGNFFLTDMECTRSGNFPLWAMNQIDRANKHRSITVVVTWGVISDPSYIVPGAVMSFNNRTFLQSGLSRRFFIPKNANTKGFENPQPTLSITFGPSEIFAGEDVLPKLRELHLIVMDALKKFQKAYSAAYL